MKASRNSFQEKMKTMIATEASIGRLIGTMMRRRICSGEAPSIIAA